MSKYNTENLGTEPVSRLLAGMSLQTTLALLLYSVYALTDTFFISRGVSAYAAGGVSLTMPVVMILGAVSTTMGTGAASIISRALGKDDKEKAAATAANTFLIFWLTALAFTVLGLLFLNPLLRLLGTDDILLPYAKSYLRIILLGAVTSTGFSALIRAEGNTRFSLYIWIFPVLINLIFDPVFIFCFGWGVEGAAAATVLAQSISAGMSVYYFFFSGRDTYKIQREHFRLKRTLIGEIISIGSPSLISQAGTSLIVTIINQILLRYGGAEAITAFGIVSRIQGFMVLPQNGIVQGMQPIVGYNFAARLYDRVKKTIRLSIAASAAYGILMLLAGILGASFLVSIFVSEPEILALGASILPLIALCFPFKGIPTIVSAVFQSEGKPFLSVSLLLFGLFAVQLPVMLLLAQQFSLTGIWMSFVISDALMCIISIFILIRSFLKTE